MDTPELILRHHLTVIPDFMQLELATREAVIFYAALYPAVLLLIAQDAWRVEDIYHFGEHMVFLTA